ncbi:hypothetical protein SK128_024082 [Halocaridina rubra]|uniref:Ig-like domain-containing protein n=1 Tax=Halocaridina rubra TaxID=373956 RepID=A0AAN8WMM8_HALRR
MADLCLWAIASVLFAHSLVICDEGTVTSTRNPAVKKPSVQYSTLVGPSFLKTKLNALTHAAVGQTAHLTCLIKNLHNYTVSSMGQHRFVAVNPGGRDKWMLRIHNAQIFDSGDYLCQVSLSPPISMTITLSVLEAKAIISPSQDVYLKAGSQVELVCEIQGCPYPALPTWYRSYQIQQGLRIEEGYIHHTKMPTITTPYITTTLPENLSYHREPEDKHPTEKSGESHSNNNDSIDVEAKNSQFINSSYRIKPTTKPHKQPSKRISKDATSFPHSNAGNLYPRIISSTFVPSRGSLPIARVTLTRPFALANHSGVYYCTNTCTAPVNLTLHVLLGIFLSPRSSVTEKNGNSQDGIPKIQFP